MHWEGRSPHHLPWCGLRSAESLCCASWRPCSHRLSSGSRKCALAGCGDSTNCTHQLMCQCPAPMGSEGYFRLGSAQLYISALSCTFQIPWFLDAFCTKDFIWHAYCIQRESLTRPGRLTLRMTP